LEQGHILTNFDILSAYYCTIAYSLAPQPCARLPDSLARACPAALRALLSRQVQTGSEILQVYYQVIDQLNCNGRLLLFPKLKDVAMLSLVYELISTCERG
jgi:hypothetical protein